MYNLYKTTNKILHWDQRGILLIFCTRFLSVLGNLLLYKHPIEQVPLPLKIGGLRGVVHPPPFMFGITNEFLFICLDLNFWFKFLILNKIYFDCMRKAEKVHEKLSEYWFIPKILPSKSREQWAHKIIMQAKKTMNKYWVIFIMPPSIVSYILVYFKSCTQKSIYRKTLGNLWVIPKILQLKQQRNNCGYISR